MIRTLLLLALIAPICRAQRTLDTLVGTSRILLVFAPSDQDLRYPQQFALLATHSAEMKQRDLLVLPLLLQSGPAVTPAVLGSAVGPAMPDKEATLTRHRFHIASKDFVAILVGKDGGEKFHSCRPVSLQQLIQLIDAMPMRQEEMRRSGH